MLKQLEPVIEKIGVNTFAITPFPAFRAANLSGELASVLAPVMGALLPLAEGLDVTKNAGNSSEESGKNSGGLFDIDAHKAARVFSDCPEISGDKIETLMRKLLLGGHITVEFEDENGRRHTEKLDSDLANEIFCGDVQDMFILCFYVIRLNFNGFFGKLTALSGGAEEVLKPVRTIL